MRLCLLIGLNWFINWCLKTQWTPQQKPGEDPVYQRTLPGPTGLWFNQLSDLEADYLKLVTVKTFVLPMKRHSIWQKSHSEAGLESRSLVSPVWPVQWPSGGSSPQCSSWFLKRWRAAAKWPRVTGLSCWVLGRKPQRGLDKHENPILKSWNSGNKDHIWTLDWWNQSANQSTAVTTPSIPEGNHLVTKSSSLSKWRRGATYWLPGVLNCTFTVEILLWLIQSHHMMFSAAGTEKTWKLLQYCSTIKFYLRKNR